MTPASLGPGLTRLRSGLIPALAVLLPVFVLVEVNRPTLAPQSQLAIFAALGLALAFLHRPAGSRASVDDAVAIGLAIASLALGAYFVVQTEPGAAAWWLDGQALGNRAGIERPLDIAVGVLGLLLILVATWRVLGPALPILALAFIAYAHWGRQLPDWLLPHRGYDWERIVSQTVLHSQGVFGIALRVMFSYVFLFVLFGALLESTGATGYIIDASRRLFRHSPGGAAKVAVLSSGLMGSLSGSAVANTATTGTFTIPMMRSAGLPAHEAAGIEAAASSGGALVPPIMGAGAYMMLEIINPPVTYLQIIRAALIPALLYYLSLFLIVHFRARGDTQTAEQEDASAADEATGVAALIRWEGVVFVGALGALLGFLLQGFTVFRSVTLGLAVVLILAALQPRTRLTARQLLEAVVRSSKSSVALIVAAACVGIVIGIVTLTGIGTRLPSLILPLAQNSLLSALGLIMVSSIVLGMGLPSAVCYLLMATLIGPALGPLGVVPLAAHLFIFYFGMMSMITPPVALAAYAASSIAGSPLLKTSAAAFRFGLVGFTLPYLFVFRPQLLMLDPQGQTAAFGDILAAVVLAILGIAPFAAGIAGYLRHRLGAVERALLFLSAALALLPGQDRLLGILSLSVWNLIGIAIFAAVLAAQWRRRLPEAAQST